MSLFEFHPTLQTYSYLQIKKGGKDQESIQSSTTPDNNFNKTVRARGLFFRVISIVIINGSLYRIYAYDMIVHARADQLLPQILMEQFDTLPS